MMISRNAAIASQIWRLRRVSSALALSVLLLASGSAVLAQDAIVEVTATAECVAPVAGEALGQITGDATHSGVQPGPAPERAPEVCWSARFPSFVSAAVAGEGLVFVGSQANNRPAIFALDADTGAEVWYAEVGESLMATTPIYHEGAVYVGGPDGLYRFDAATGERDWRFRVGTDEMGFPQGFGAPILADGGVFGSSGALASGTLYAIDAETGDERWSVESTDGGFTPAAANDGLVFVGNYDRSLRAYDMTTGDERWTITLGGQPTGNVHVSADLVVVAHGGLQVGAFDTATGEERWSFQVEGAAGVSTIAGTGDLIYVHAGSVLTALNVADGSAAWTADVGASVGGGFTAPGGPVIVDGTLYIPTFTEEMQAGVLALDAVTGAEVWRAVDEDSFYSTMTTPAVTGGRIYVGVFFMSGELLALGTT